jgi:hypothetical protein
MSLLMKSSSLYVHVSSLLWCLVLGAWCLVLGVVLYSDTQSCCSCFCLYVQEPDSLVREEGYRHESALFGVPASGTSIRLPVYYADSTLCDSSNGVDTSSGYPERPIGDNGQMLPWSEGGLADSFILMVDRGGCIFVNKARMEDDSIKKRLGSFFR